MSQTTSTRFQFLTLWAAAQGLAYFFAFHWAARTSALPVRPEASAALAIAVAIFAAWRLRSWLEQTKSPRAPASRVAHLFVAVLAFPILYGSTGPLITALGLQNQDSALQAIDEQLLGWLFPRGQLTLAADASGWVGPETFVGRLLTEVFQLSYFSYYFWGFGLFFLLLDRWRRTGGGAGSAEARDRVERFVCAWVGGYLLNFLGYLTVPAIGPQFVLKDQYAHAISGFGVAAAIQRFILSQQATLQDCFPSGHTALSWIAALSARELAPTYARYASVAAILITGATLWLRYHWVTDLLGAIPLVAIALFWGGFLSMETSKRSGP